MAMTKFTIILSALMTFLLFASGPAWAQAKETRPAAKAITGPDAVDNQLDDDQDEKPNLLDTKLLKSWEDWKADIADRSGLSFGLDYNALGLAATDSLGDETSASGVFRLFGTWNFIGRGTKNAGGIVFKVEHRHAYTDEFTSGNFEFDAGVSAVAITAGVQAKAGTEGATAGASAGPATGVQAQTNYHKGMAVFVHAKGGLMCEATVGGQKFSFEPKK